MTKQIAALNLAFLLLFSTLTFKVDMHFCGDHLVDFSITSNVEGCNMSNSTAGTFAGCPMASMNCCTDVEFFLQGQEDLKTSADNIAQTLPPLLAQPLRLPVMASFWAAPRLLQQFREYSPPPLIRKVHLLHETFLI